MATRTPSPLPRARQAEFARWFAAFTAGVVERGERVDIAVDRHIKAVLAQIQVNPSPESRAKYLADHARMSATGSEPVKLASTARHFDRLRTAWKLGEAERIRALRLASERARKAGNKEEQTRSLNLALIAAWRLQRDYIGDERHLWKHIAASKKAHGQPTVCAARRKKATARHAPSAEQLQLMCEQRKLDHHMLPMAVLALFGVRPAELQKGVRLSLNDAGHVVAHVDGAKVVAGHQGQTWRTIERQALPIGARVLPTAADWLAQRIREHGKDLVVTVGRSQMNAIRGRLLAWFEDQGISPYSFRHRLAADMKAAHHSRAEIARALGHSNDKSQTYYGHYQHGRQSRSPVVAAQAAGAVKAVARVKATTGWVKPARPASTPTPSGALPRPVPSPVPTIPRGPKLPWK